MKQNPMLKALDGKIAELEAQRAALAAQIDTLNETRAELAGLVRKRKPKQPTAAVSAVA